MPEDWKTYQTRIGEWVYQHYDKPLLEYFNQQGARVTKKKITKRNPQDATRRNVQAANKKLQDILARMSKLEDQAREAHLEIVSLEFRLSKLEQEHADTPDLAAAALDSAETK